MITDLIDRISKLRRFLSEYDQPGLAPADVVEETLEKIRRLEEQAAHIMQVRQTGSLAEYNRSIE